jgi:hypothetical protein
MKFRQPGADEKREPRGTEVQVALQGTLETFALADVLRLLASTRKTGVLRIDGDRGTGELTVVDGAVGAATATGAPRAEHTSEVLFELLRYRDGSFVFDTDAAAAERVDRSDDVAQALAAAEEQLQEWRAIEAVVPSPTRLVVLIGERDGADITLSADQWRGVVALGDGCSTLTLSERLGLSELPATRLVRDLVELGAARVSDEDEQPASAPSVATSAPPPPPAPEPAPAPEIRHEPVPDVPDSAPSSPPPAADPLLSGGPSELTPSAFADSPSFIDQHRSAAADDERPLFGGNGTDQHSAFAPAADTPAFAAPPPPPGAPAAEAPIAGWNDDPDDSLSSFHDDAVTEPTPLFGDTRGAPGLDDPFGPDPFQLPKIGEVVDQEEATELARQLANLSPRAQQAVAAAASASTDAERDEAIARAEDASDEPINRNLLLKYLSSVDE